VDASLCARVAMWMSRKTPVLGHTGDLAGFGVVREPMEENSTVATVCVEAGYLVFLYLRATALPKLWHVLWNIMTSWNPSYIVVLVVVGGLCHWMWLRGGPGKPVSSYTQRRLRHNSCLLLTYMYINVMYVK